MIRRTMLFLCLSLVFVKPLFADRIGYSLGNDVNVRSGHGENYRQYKILYQLDRNDKVKIQEEKEGWYRITSEAHPDISSQDQWVLGKFISVVDNAPLEQKEDEENEKEEKVIVEENKLTDLDLLWSMPSSFLGQKVSCFFYIHEVQENDDFYSVMVGDGNKFFDMKNPMQFDVRVPKGDISFIKNVVKAKGKNVILSGNVKKYENTFMSLYYLAVNQIRY